MAHNDAQFVASQQSVQANYDAKKFDFGPWVNAPRGGACYTVLLPAARNAFKKKHDQFSSYYEHICLDTRNRQQCTSCKRRKRCTSLCIQMGSILAWRKSHNRLAGRIECIHQRRAFDGDVLGMHHGRTRCRPFDFSMGHRGWEYRYQTRTHSIHRSVLGSLRVGRAFLISR